MKYVIQIGSVAIIYIRFHKTGSFIIILKRSYTDTQEEYRRSLLLESRLKRYRYSHVGRGCIPGSLILAITRRPAESSIQLSIQLVLRATSLAKEADIKCV